MLTNPNPAANELTAPLNNFFNDPLLTLLYFSKDGQERHVGSDELPYIKPLLLQVVDRKIPKHVRANAAADIGCFVRRNERLPDRNSRHSNRQVSRAVPWFQLARELGSVVGSSELAAVFLARDGKRLVFDATQDILPRVSISEPCHTEQEDDGEHMANEVIVAWKDGASVVYRHLQRRFQGWGREEFQSAFSCILSFLMFPRVPHLDSRIMLRREALKWINPVWSALIEIAPSKLRREGTSPEAVQALLIEQRLAVLHYLYDKPGANAAEHTWIRLSDFAVQWGISSSAFQTARLAGAPQRRPELQTIIVNGPIPASSDRAEQEILNLYKGLQKSLPLVALQPLDSLHSIEATLLEEFPWAQDAVAAVLDDLLARRRSGSVRLGLATFLLVGPPGSGKTRFAQRLGSLLDVPNTFLNLAGMSDNKLLKGCTRGWSGARPSRIVEFVQQTAVANPFFILDELDKLGREGMNGDPQAALLDLFEPGNARRYLDVFLMAECDLSHCIYIGTANSLQPISAPLLSRIQPITFPMPGEEHFPVLINGVLRDFEASRGLPAGALTLPPYVVTRLRGLSPREIRAAIPRLLGRGGPAGQFRRH